MTDECYICNRPLLVSVLRVYNAHRGSFCNLDQSPFLFRAIVCGTPQQIYTLGKVGVLDSGQL